ncbi:MAG: hypothetical protein JXA66_02435 [Oligoflexia bacterium]|nr:hypothetical protein [Oligoflexia bacterium]
MLINSGYGVILPPSYVLGKFQETRLGVGSIKLKQQVIEGNNDFTFTETIWYKAGDRFRVYVEKDSDAILFIRQGKECTAITASSTITADDLCNGFENNFFYSTVFSHGNFPSFLKSFRIEYPVESDHLGRPDKNYKDPEGSFILRNDTTPIYVIGITKSMYRSALSGAKSEKPGELGDRFLKEIKNEAPQIWLDKKDFSPVRIYGKSKKDGSETETEILFKSYKTDINEVPYAASIEVYYRGERSLSYGIRDFETKKDLNDQLFDVAAYRKKFPRTINADELDKDKTRLLEYLKAYR